VAVKVVALAGGVGGARLADGLAQVLPPEDLTIVVNTGDDFEHLGLSISPDVDTVTYTLAGIENPATGWGRAGESWSFLESLRALGGPDWFQLGDRDLAVHTLRTAWLQQGWTLSEVTEKICRHLGVRHAILPMTDDPVRTTVETTEGDLPFQVYFVARACAPRVLGFRFEGITAAAPSPGVREALALADCIVLCPSNPFVSLDPILAVPGIREGILGKQVIGISPIIGGRALKGPAAKMLEELGHPVSCLSVARHFRSLLTDFVIDEADVDAAPEIRDLGIRPHVTGSVMRNRGERTGLARRVLRLGDPSRREAQPT
jgi:LPPG:FO 2-phospho-L-lactate transferase